MYSPFSSATGWLELLGSSFYSVQSLGWKVKVDCTVSEVEITRAYVIQNTFGVLVSYLREDRPGNIDP